MKNEKRILVIIPAWNEERSITRVVEKIRKLYPGLDVLVVDDGSSDTTGAAARLAGARVIRHPYNLGIGGAVQTGFQAAVRGHYDIAIQMDADEQHDPAFLEVLIGPVAEGRLDLVIGSRFLQEGPGDKSSPARRLGIRFFARLLEALIRVPVTDPTSGFRAVSRRLFEKFARDYPVDFPEPEAIKRARRFGARIGEVPVTMHPRSGGRSSIGSLGSFYYMIKVTLAILIDMLRRRPQGGFLE